VVGLPCNSSLPGAEIKALLGQHIDRLTLADFVVACDTDTLLGRLRQHMY